MNSSDESFKKEIVRLYANGKAATLKKLQETFNENTLAKGTDITVSDGFRISVPQNLQPVIGNIVGKYGKPDKIEKNVYYYGDVGLQTENGKPDDKVSSIVVVCSIHAKGPSL